MLILLSNKDVIPLGAAGMGESFRIMTYIGNEMFLIMLYQFLGNSCGSWVPIPELFALFISQQYILKQEPPADATQLIFLEKNGAPGENWKQLITI